MKKGKPKKRCERELVEVKKTSKKKFTVEQ